jgi:hypothetical protein
MASAPPEPPESKEEIAIRDRGLRSLIDRVPALTDITISSLHASEPAYRSNIPLGQLQKQLATSIGQILEISRIPPDERDGAMAWAHEIGRFRARQGFPVQAMHRGYHTGGTMLFYAFMQWASEEEGLPHDRLISFADDVWDVVDLHCAEATAAFHAAEREMSDDRSAEHAHLLDALLSGDAHRDAVTAAARAWALPEQGRYAVLVQRTSVWGVPLPRTAELPAKIAGFRVVWRIHVGCAIGVVAIGDAAVARIAAALPPAPGRRTGISLAVDGLAELGRARRLAELAARTITARDGVSCLEEHLPTALLTARPDLARELFGRVLGPVFALDSVSRDLLLDTLAAWLATDGSAERAASVLRCHRNTVMKRIRQFERMTRRSLSTLNDLVEVSLAFEAFRLGSTPSSRRPPR